LCPLIIATGLIDVKRACPLSGLKGTVPSGLRGTVPSGLRRGLSLFCLKTGGRTLYDGRVKRKIRCGGKPMTAIVLAGGRGRRMKEDKAGLAVGDRTLLEHVLSQLEPYFSEILISVSPGQARRLGGPSKGKKMGRAKRAVPDLRQKLKIIEDEIPGLGPLGGILAGLKAAANDACAVIACDIPDINVPLIRSLARAAHDAEIAVPVGPAGHCEPLFAVYRKSAIPEIEALLRTGERSILPLFGRCRTTVLRLADAAWLRNLNTRADYESYLRSIAGGKAGPSKNNRLAHEAWARTKAHAGSQKKACGVQRPGRPKRP